jgi:hypothetical protein
MIPFFIGVYLSGLTFHCWIGWLEYRDLAEPETFWVHVRSVVLVLLWPLITLMMTFIGYRELSVFKRTPRGRAAREASDV